MAPIADETRLSATAGLIRGRESVHRVPSAIRPPFVWGKRERGETEAAVRTQSLADHSLDVAGAFSALLRSSVIRSRLHHLAGGRPLAPEVCDRLAYLVFLHDVGKCNAGFQARWSPTARVVGHIAPLAAVIGKHADPQLNSAFLDALNASLLFDWGRSVDGLFHAIISHHGRPWPRDERRHYEERHWRSDASGYDPIAAVGALRQEADVRFPGALGSGGAPLPDAPAFIHAVAGLTQLADWIGSSDWMRDAGAESTEEWADRRIREIGLNPPSRSRSASQNVASLSFESLFGRAAHQHQGLAAGVSGRLVILECETGSGKTEAALWRFAQLFERGDVGGLYFALPTRTAAVSIHERVSAFVRAFWGTSAPPVVLAIPGYLDRPTDESTTGGLPPAPDSLDRIDDDERTPSPWAAQHPKRFFAATISVGTIDQALLAALRVKHAHLRGAALMRHLLVVDEVHASDAYMRRILVRLLRDHLAAGGHALLLSATLGAEARHEMLVECSGGRVRDALAPNLDVSVAAAYPLVSTAIPTSATSVNGAPRPKNVSVQLREWLDDPVAIARFALDAANDGAKVLVVRNTIAGAVEMQRALEQLAGESHPAPFRVQDVVTLHHGRFAREDRVVLDAGIEQFFGKERERGGKVVVGTQTLEQSLDIDADLLITDLCPADVLLQRIGRLHRHAFRRPEERPEAFQSAQAIVLTPATGLAEFLRSARPGRRKRHGLGFRIQGGTPVGVYRDLVILEATRRLVLEYPVWEIPAMNRLLVERATHSEALDAVVDALPDDERPSWEAHRQRVFGDNLAQGVQADDGLLQRDRDLMEEPNTRFEDALATRLGANDVLLDLPAATVGPLRQIVTRLSVPAWMLSGIQPEVTPLVVQSGTDEWGTLRLDLHLDDLTLVYDRLGLRTDKEHAL